MTHIFVSPHPDDAALSCGGLIAGLRELGQNVAILTVFSGGPSDGNGDLTDYQRTALGFGSKTVWPNSEAFRRDVIGADVPIPAGIEPWAADPERIAVTQDYANTQSRQFWQRAAWGRSANITNVETPERPLSDSIGAQGSDEVIDLESADAMTIRRAEDERYAWFMEATVIQLDLPDAVFRGYEGDEQLLGAVRDDDPAPTELLRAEILRLEPQMVYFPLAIGGHVDHQLCREAGVALLDEGRQWVMPGPDLVGSISFYEDFPYAWWHDFAGVADLPDLDLPPGVSLEPRVVDISDTIERKSAGLRMYQSQVERLFSSEQGMRDDLAGFHARTAIAAGRRGFAERTWAPVRA